MTVFVEAPARLHFGMLDLAGTLGRRFGGIGAAVPTPSLLISAEPRERITAEGPEAERAIRFAHRFVDHYGIEGRGAHFCVHRAIPKHNGLGSGTQLALAIARSMAELYALDDDPAGLATAVGRARRSAIGTWTFAHGGFVLEGGRRSGAGDAPDQPAPLLARLPIPPQWRCVIAVPRAALGVSGDAEVAAFASLPEPPLRDVEHVAHVVLMSLLPALVEGDLSTFGAALTEVQYVTGRWFAPAQGGAFAPGVGAALIAQMRDWGAAGVGQSSWGPAVYGIVGDEATGIALAQRVRAALPESDGAVYEGPFSHTGARVWIER
ncbi:MAG TPA: beta-ribofuranosylaminobenzene 5'-phosphate synthase family protein [Gemmatimonadaceae bacterium]|nr:beta-ribofuranosylaminobenzene 5'-phosphate synthase family protein [Gemmatimonadaceae bacterium]